MATKPATAEEREGIRRLHGEGKGRNEIANLLRRSGKTISDHAEALGSSLDRAAEVGVAPR